MYTIRVDLIFSIVILLLTIFGIGKIAYDLYQRKKKGLGVTDESIDSVINSEENN